ncbi:MAG: FAD-dependent monooxygenase [Defluviicoccus sp.]|nr:FAD-dependent monooxygenase [Defluviicoccus sp.]
MSGTQDRVLIAGAGPVGSVAALALARAGIPVTLVEACDSLPLDLRASTFHPPTLDMLDELDVVDALIAQGIVCPVWQNRDTARGIVAEWDLGVLRDDTGHPYRVQAEQYKLNGIVVDILEGMQEAEVRFSTEAVAARQDSDRVMLDVDGPGGAITLTGRYLIAADGASSVVRIGAGIGFPGLTFPELWLCTSTEYDFAAHFENLAPIAYVADPESWFVFVRVPGLWRLLMPTRPGDTAEELVSEEVVQARMHAVCPKEGPYETYHRTAYAVHQRVAETYRAGRIFLAGDSAHINNPLGGMGMNGGIHDAVNLCAKIVKVWHGEADEALFDLYDAQRRPIAVEYVQAATLRNKALLEERDPTVREKRLDDLARQAEDPAKAREFLLRSSMIAALRKAEAVG